MHFIQTRFPKSRLVSFFFFLTMATERISQILPSVKCSDCGRDVQIRRLGDHVCSSKPPVPELPIIPKAKGKV